MALFAISSKTVVLSPAISRVGSSLGISLSEAWIEHQLTLASTERFLVQSASWATSRRRFQRPPAKHIILRFGSKIQGACSQTMSSKSAGMGRSFIVEPIPRPYGIGRWTASISSHPRAEQSWVLDFTTAGTIFTWTMSWQWLLLWISRRSEVLVALRGTLLPGSYGKSLFRWDDDPIFDNTC